ncbi:hypothetical protein SNEBB_001859, partial [Seison nebaliae]
WSGNLKDPTKHINLPPLDLQTISSNSPHYFHTSITSSIYKEIIWEIYDSSLKLMRMKFNNSRPVDELDWFSISKLTELNVYGNISPNMVDTIKAASFLTIEDIPLLTKSIFVVVTEEMLYYPMTIYEVCPNNYLTSGLMCYQKTLPFICYQSHSSYNAFDMNEASHVVISGIIHHPLST